MSDAPAQVAYGQPESPEAAAAVEALVKRLRFLPELQESKVGIGLSALLSAYLTLARDASVDSQAAEQVVKAGLAYLQQKLGSPQDPNLSEHSLQRLRIAQRLGFVLSDEDHALALDAVMFVYRTLAKKHTCCLEESIRVASFTAEELRRHQAAIGMVSARVH
jgi:hypothetical protein